MKMSFNHGSAQSAGLDADFSNLRIEPSASNRTMKLTVKNKRYSVIEVSPNDLAGQLTLLDLPLFKAITRDEMMKQGNSSRKQELAPNVVAMNRQFNQVSFLVMSQILLHDSPRSRAELISHFIETAKQLYKLNNLHSSYAVVSALLSSSIHRLAKTWNYVRKKYSKEKQQFDQLRELYSDENNYELLRNHLANSGLPCIPYLGMYFRDIIHINEVHQEGTIQRTTNTSKIFESIEKFQLSQYDHLELIPSIHCCLLSNRYIDELQKLVEDENYSRSLELEPQEMPQVDRGSSESNQGRQRKSAMLLASLTSMVQSAVLTTSNRFGGTSPRRSSADSQKTQKYLIDDSFIDHTNFPPPISTSN